MELSFSNMAAGIVFGAFAIYAFKRGKKYSRLMDFLVGGGLLIFPYFIQNPWVNWSVGLVLLYILYFYRNR